MFAALPCRSRLLPVVSLKDPKAAIPLAQALLAGGVDAIEITLRHPSALTAIAELVAAKLPITVLAGTVLTSAQVEAVASLGVAAALSPGLDATVVKAAQRLGLTFIPGVATPSEAMAAAALGCHALKFFPATSYGGIDSLKSMAAVFPDLSFCPTGGIDASNCRRFLELKNVGVVGGSWLTPAALIERGDWQAITTLAREASALVPPATSSPSPH